MDIEDVMSGEVTQETVAGLPYPPGFNLEDYSEAELFFLTTYAFLIAVTSTLVNGALMFVFARTRSLHTPMNTLFMSLIVDGFLCGSFGGWLSFGHSVARKRMSSFACGFDAFMVFFSGNSCLCRGF